MSPNLLLLLLFIRPFSHSLNCIRQTASDMVHNCDESPFRPSVGVIISNNILANDILKRSDRLCTVYVLGFQFITARRYAYRSMSVTHESFLST